MISPENKIKRRERTCQEYRDKYVGEKYGMLTVLDFTGYKGKHSTLVCKVKCDCGNEKEIIFISVKDGNTTSCGCKMFTDINVLIKEKTEEYVGKKFGTLTVLKILGYGKKGWDIVCQVKCECGIVKEMSLYRLIKNAKSCGCKTNELLSIHHTKHGLLKHPLYKIWSGIKSRCTNEKSVHYPRYGGKGVEMCEEWANDFVKFYNWCLENGWEKGLHVDKDIKARLLNQEGLLYSPEWCSIVTMKENCNTKSNNRMLEINGIKMNLQQVCNEYDIPHSTLTNRLKRGWDETKAATTPRMIQFASH